jgi:hypothetical protein
VDRLKSHREAKIAGCVNFHLFSKRLRIALNLHTPTFMLSHSQDRNMTDSVFFTELRRRRVLQVAGAYIAIKMGSDPCFPAGVR